MQHKRSLKRHCMIVHAYFPCGETRVERQAHALIRHGFEVDVLCLRRPDEKPRETIDGVRIFRLPVRRHKEKGFGADRQLFEYISFMIFALIYLIRMQFSRNYNVIQIHSPPDFLVFSGIVSKIFKKKIILDLHDLMPEFAAERFNWSRKNFGLSLIYWQEKLSCLFADHVITVTEKWRQTLIKRGQPAKKVSVVMNVPDHRIFNKNVSPNIRNNDGKFLIIYHGAISFRCGLDIALKAVAAIKGSIPNIELLIRGGGEYRKSLIQLAESLSLNHHVKFNNMFVPTHELAKIIKSANIAIVPYRNDRFTNEVLPTKLLEYLSLGVPVIASRTETICDYFDDTMIEFFEPGSVDGLALSIEKLYRDPARLKELVKASDKFFKLFNWKRLGKEYAVMVENLGNK